MLKFVAQQFTSSEVHSNCGRNFPEKAVKLDADAKVKQVAVSGAVVGGIIGLIVSRSPLIGGLVAAGSAFISVSVFCSAVRACSCFRFLAQGIDWQYSTANGLRHGR